jgi:hypothetical protein
MQISFQGRLRVFDGELNENRKQYVFFEDNFLQIKKLFIYSCTVLLHKVFIHVKSESFLSAMILKQAFTTSES